MLTKETFKRLVIAIRDHGEFETREIGGTVYRVYEISELSLVLSKFKNAWKPEGVSLKLFDVDFFISPDGSITIVSEDDDDRDAEVYSLTDAELLSVVGSFVNWRLSVMNKLDI